MRIGIFIGSMGSAPDVEGQVQQVVNAERDGFDSFWSAQVMGVDALTLFALAGQRTGTIELGTAVVPIYTRHPLALAQQALTTQAACGGRLSLGIGLAHKRTVEGSLGLSFEKPASRMIEYLAVTRSLLEEGTVNHRGEFYKVSATVGRPEGPPPPVLMAALGQRMLRTAGQSADGTITWMVGPKTLREHIGPGVRAAAEASGRPPPRVCVGVPIAVTDNATQANAQAHEYFHRYGELPSYRRMLDIEGVDGPADVAVFGNETAVEARLRRLADAGATDLLASIFPVGPDAQASIARTRQLLKSLVGKITG